MQELICNLHIHSVFSDGTGTCAEILDAAAEAGVDVVILTDHNLYIRGIDGYYESKSRKVLLLAAEEVHDQSRIPQKNHMLVLGAGREVATAASDPQVLIDLINRSGGYAFFAHPDEMDLPLFHETAITWENWEVTGAAGFELWNGMSEFKTVSRSPLQIIKHAFWPATVAHHPSPKTLERWDKLLAEGRHVCAVGGTDAHSLHVKLGPFVKTIFPYRFHFSTINNHLLLPEGLTGNIEEDRKRVFQAIGHGNLFIGYDLPASTRGFSFTMENDSGKAMQGQTLPFARGNLARVEIPQHAMMRLLHNGTMIHQSSSTTHFTIPVTEAGAYRVECFIDFLGEKRGWIFSNPIYLEKV